MKFKNKDGTINAIPIVCIFTAVSLVLYILLFGVEIKQKVEDKANEIFATTTTTKPKTTVSLCNGCNINFISDHFDVVINGQVDLSELMKLHKVTINNVSFESEDSELFTVTSYKSTYVIKTGNKTGSAKIKATFDKVTAEATINVLNVSTGLVKFKNDYYFVALGKNAKTSLEIYPYSLNINNIKYSSSDGSVGIGNDGTIQGKSVGSSVIKLQVGNIKDEAKVYVVQNLIKVKTNQNGNFAEAMNITPAGDEFDIIVTFEDTKKENYDFLNLALTFDSNELGAQTKYISPDRTPNSYIYHVTLQNGAKGKSLLRVTLSDGSFTLFEINK